MRNLTLLLIIGSIVITSCKSYQPKQIIDHDDPNALVKSDSVAISSDETDYEIIIFEPGFNQWLQSTARPRGYYSQQFLEDRNAILVQNWNLRHSQPSQYNPDLYLQPIDYDIRTDYGYEVNYLLYNYFVYFQLTYNQRLSTFIPKI
ncbi:hypothetical protein J4050_08930 [Winogradskyella sp. DF17]|uniref:Lipoprotein n=1 Tax=Winogradskyella pelagia TaxID=2819984 RepID=A0ABS3T327_9FLAO|nr:DUF6146 family protein [Winogradskyella sp. DF17]MBO3116869.1 hypothetical protein [Winogradskyella sp. DF17]